MLFKRNRCSDCDGSGKCRECYGSGVNVHFSQDDPKCKKCGGSGTCPICKGTGRLK